MSRDVSEHNARLSDPSSHPFDDQRTWHPLDVGQSENPLPNKESRMDRVARYLELSLILLRAWKEAQDRKS